MKLTKKQIDDILQQEINWCLDNPDKELNHDQQMGFINGLRQAQLLIEKADRALREHRDVLTMMPIQITDSQKRELKVCMDNSIGEAAVALIMKILKESGEE